MRMTESYYKHGLVSKEEWEKAIREIKRQTVQGVVQNHGQLKEQVKRALISAIELRTKGLDHFCIFFSGGIDSTIIAIICKQLKKNFTCIAVGFQDTAFKEPEDLIWAKKIATELGLALKMKIYPLQETEAVFKEVVHALGDYANVVNVGVGSVVVAAAKLANDQDFFSGLGSEEIFAGYDRHKKNPSNEECWNGLLQMHERDLIRDTLLANHLNIRIHTPFLDDGLIKEAMSVPIAMKLHEDHVKYILREIAIDLGLKEAFAMRKKRAAQYGSSFDRAMQKLAKKNNFVYKQDYLTALKSQP
ncbi:hypothetical protein C4573_05085 [Candidatus Woesearchaeota archaeon]|nr:MAG: hypothetical protein C4573_05085 [Candidatus Woesearchaeota archaeon]